MKSVGGTKKATPASVIRQRRDVDQTIVDMVDDVRNYIDMKKDFWSAQARTAAEKEEKEAAAREVFERDALLLSAAKERSRRQIGRMPAIDGKVVG